MKAVGNILATLLVTIVGLGVIWTLQNTSYLSPAAIGSDPQPVNPFPTFTNTPVVLETPTPVPTRTPIPTSTPIPRPTSTLTWQQLKDSAYRVPYEDLMRYPHDYFGKTLYFEGKATHVHGDDKYIFILMSVVESSFFSGNVYLVYKDAPIRVLDEDWIEVVGRFHRLYTYKSVGAGVLTVPDIEVFDLKFVD